MECQCQEAHATPNFSFVWFQINDLKAKDLSSKLMDLGGGGSGGWPRDVQGMVDEVLQ